jgi:FkbM family methyltransferase
LFVAAELEFVATDTSRGLKADALLVKCSSIGPYSYWACLRLDFMHAFGCCKRRVLEFNFVQNEDLKMSGLQTAVLWWKQLFNELETAAHTGDAGELGQQARDRSGALVNLFFSILKDSETKNLLEIGAHNAEASRRFVASDLNTRAFAYEASQAVFDRVVKGGIPERMEMFNVAVGAKSGEIRFFVPVQERLQVWASTRKRAGNVESIETIVPIITLDQIARRIPRSGSNRDIAMWVDVEGSGHDVIKGGPALLRDRVSLIYMEVNDFETYEGASTVLDILQDLLRLGFIPVARDNQYHDAWNLLLAHESTYNASRSLITKWTYNRRRTHVS